VARLGLSSRILIGLALGILVGLFFGEPAAALQPLADVYIRLMQMTVLPYLVLTLINGLGRMDAHDAKRLAVRGGLLLLVLWAGTLAVVALMPLAFPPLESASFFSTSLLEPRQSLALQEIYVPANPFNAMANGVVPAVVLFCCALGVALIGLENRATLLENLRALEGAVMRVTGFIVSLTPLGVFAIAAVVAGTMDLATLQRLEVYLVCFAVAALLLAFVVLPLTVTALTPLTYREVISASRDALLTAFVASSVFIVLPMLVERARSLLEQRRARTPDADSAIEVLVPLAFTFPNAGKLLTLLFVPYAAWLAGNPIEPGGYPALFAVGIPAYFAKAQVALPFLLDLMGVPQDHFQLYIPTTIVTGKFDSMVSAMSVLAFALLGAGAMSGSLRVAPARIASRVLIMVLALAAAILGTRLLLPGLTDTTYRKAEMLQRMHGTRMGSDVIVHRHRAGIVPDPAEGSVPTLERVRARGTLRIGYEPGNTPFSFFNAKGELAGFDVEMATGLAEALGVRPEFVPVGWKELPEVLADNRIDVMPGVWYRPFWFRQLRLSAPYLEGTMAIVTRDERRHEFESVSALRRSRGLRIGVPLDARQVRASIAQYFGEASVELVPLESTVAFFAGERPDLDAVLMPAESGSALTLLHPQYSVVVPQPHPVRIPTAFGTALHSGDLVEAVNEWIVYAKSEGSIQRAYDYWVLGKGAEEKGRRWSILRDVLGWGR
jgi:Na+/H+-dicarboxylate symporter